MRTSDFVGKGFGNESLEKMPMLLTAAPARALAQAPADNDADNLKQATVGIGHQYNVLGTKADAANFYYIDWLMGGPAAGIGGQQVHLIEPRTADFILSMAL
jgi:hypothetical protein